MTARSGCALCIEPGTIEVAVHLVGRGSEGEVLFDGNALHVYTFEGDLLKRMTIEE
jgi:hypothetical protein